MGRYVQNDRLSFSLLTKDHNNCVHLACRLVIFCMSRELNIQGVNLITLFLMHYSYIGNHGSQINFLPMFLSVR